MGEIIHLKMLAERRVKLELTKAEALGNYFCLVADHAQALGLSPESACFATTYCARTVVMGHMCGVDPEEVAMDLIKIIAKVKRVEA